MDYNNNDTGRVKETDGSYRCDRGGSKFEVRVHTYKSVTSIAKKMRKETRKEKIIKICKTDTDVTAEKTRD